MIFVFKTSVSKYAFLQMKSGGSIINISSMHAIETTPIPGAIDTPMLWQNPNIKAGLELVGKDSLSYLPSQNSAEK